MPKKRLSLEEFESLGEQSVPRDANEAIGQQAKSTTQKVLSKAAEIKTGLPDIGALFGRPDLFGDLLRLATFPISEPINLALGNKSFAEKITSEQQTPSFQSLKGSDFGRVTPDMIQGALVSAGQLSGGLAAGVATGGPGAVPGAITGGAAMSVPATRLAEGIREFSPEFFGENLENVSIGGAEIPTEQFNLMMDAAIPMAAGAGKVIAKNFKNQAARALVKGIGRDAPEEIAQAYTDIVNPAKLVDNPLEVDERFIPEFSSGSFGASLEPVEQVAAVRPRIERQIKNAEKTKNFLINEVGLTPEELKDFEPRRTNLELANTLPQRRRAKAFEFAPGEKVSPSTARGIDMLAGANRNFTHLKATAKARYNYVQDQLALQGNTDITLDEGTKTALTTLHENLSKLVEDAPELANAYGKPKRTIEQILGLPQVTKSVNKKGDTIITLEKTVESPKAIKRTSGATVTKSTDTGKVKTKESETTKQAISKEGEIGSEEFAQRLASEEVTTVTPPEELSAISEGVDFNALVELNSQLKRGVNRGKLVQSEDLPVISTINLLERAIIKDLRERPGGEMLARKYNEGSKATALRYRLFKPPVEKLLKGEPEQAWNAIAKSEAASNSFLKATGNNNIAKKEIMFRIMDEATEIHNGLEVFSPNKALRTWKDSPGFRTRFTANHRNKVEQFLKVAAASTPDISDIGKFAVAMRSGNLVVNVGQSFLSDRPLSSIPRALTGASIWFGGRMGLSRILMDPEAAVIATRLLKTPAKSPRATGDLRRLMAYLNGTKAIINIGNQSVETTVDNDLLSRVRFANKQQPNEAHDLLSRVRSVQ